MNHRIRILLLSIFFIFNIGLRKDVLAQQPAAAQQTTTTTTAAAAPAPAATAVTTERVTPFVPATPAQVVATTPPVITEAPAQGQVTVQQGPAPSEQQLTETLPAVPQTVTQQQTVLTPQQVTSTVQVPQQVTTEILVPQQVTRTVQVPTEVQQTILTPQSIQIQQQALQPFVLNWDWNQLMSIIDSYCANDTALPQVGAAPEQAPIASQQNLSQIWQSLPIPWNVWASQAVQNNDVATWNKEQLKLWLNNYAVFIQALMGSPITPLLTTPVIVAPIVPVQPVATVPIVPTPAPVPAATTTPAAGTTEQGSTALPATPGQPEVVTNPEIAPSGGGRRLQETTTLPTAGVTTTTQQPQGTTVQLPEQATTTTTTQTVTQPVVTEQAAPAVAQPLVAPFLDINDQNQYTIDNNRNVTLWQDYYDLPFIDETIIRKDLQDQGVLPEFQQWYNLFFGPQGLAMNQPSPPGRFLQQPAQPVVAVPAAGQTTAAQPVAAAVPAVPVAAVPVAAQPVAVQPATTTQTLPVQPVEQAPLPPQTNRQQIINWVTNMVFREVENLCPECYQELVALHSQTGPQRPLVLINVAEFTPPSGCVRTEARVCCTLANNQQCFDLNQINTFFASDISQTCNQLQQIQQTCQADAACHQRNVSSYFTNIGRADQFAFFYFNKNYINQLQQQCAQVVPGFNVSAEQLTQGFS